MGAAFRAWTGVARQGRSSEWMFGHTPLHLQGRNGRTGVVTRWRGREGQYSWRRSGRRAGMMGGEGVETAACKLQKIRALAILQILFLFYRLFLQIFILFYRFYFYFTDFILQFLFYRFYFIDFIFYFTDFILLVFIFLFYRFHCFFYRFYFYFTDLFLFYRF